MTYHDPAVDITHALAEAAVPAAVVDRQGRFRWLNRGAIEVVGESIGQPFAHAVAPHDLHLARTHFARKLLGEATPTHYELTIVNLDRLHLRVRVWSVPFWERGEITGVFGLACPVDQAFGRDAVAAHRAAEPDLTARQHEALTLLAEGLGTGAIATRLGIAEETARNHIRGLLRQLGVHSRLEAVVRAYELGLLPARGAPELPESQAAAPEPSSDEDEAAGPR